MDPIKIYDYLTKAREKVFDAVRTLTPEQYSRESAIGMKTLGTTLTHIMIVEWSYTERMQQRTLPPYEQWPIQDEKPPAFAVIEKTWRDQAPKTRAIVERFFKGGKWSEEFQYISQSRPANSSGGGKLVKTQITISPADLFTQMTLHEMHHRAQVMAMLREFGGPTAAVQDIDFGYMMFKRLTLNESEPV